jgi:hypothetical protein
MGRRDFWAAAGASALALKLGLFDFGASLFADDRTTAKKPRMRALFFRPDKDKYWMSWPGKGYDPDQAQIEYTKTLTAAAKQLDVHLDVCPVPINSVEAVAAAVEQIEQFPPDGLILTAMHVKSWPVVNCVMESKGNIPTVVFSPLGTSFAEHHGKARKTPKTFVAATPNHSWLATGMRLLKTSHEMERARICILTDAATGDQKISPVGTTLHFVPLARWNEELCKVKNTPEMREIAKYYVIESKSIVEPEKEDVFNAVKNYVVARRIMAAEQCDGISVDCSPLVGNKRAPCGPCLAWSRLLDEGIVGACEADGDAAVSLLLALRLFGRPGFMQDPAPNTVDNTVIASHCTCATKLEGPDKPHAPFTLRSHFESNTGLALQVQWPAGREITMLKFQRPESMLVGTGRVVGNVQPSVPSGCRTAVEIEIDGSTDPRDVKGHHQVLVCGKFDKRLKAFCKLTGLKVVAV